MGSSSREGRSFKQKEIKGQFLCNSVRGEQKSAGWPEVGRDVGRQRGRETPGDKHLIRI